MAGLSASGKQGETSSAQRNLVNTGLQVSVSVARISFIMCSASCCILCEAMV